MSDRDTTTTTYDLAQLRYGKRSREAWYAYEKAEDEAWSAFCRSRPGAEQDYYRGHPEAKAEFLRMLAPLRDIRDCELAESLAVYRREVGR